MERLRIVRPSARIVFLNNSDFIHPVDGPQAETAIPCNMDGCRVIHTPDRSPVARLQSAIRVVHLDELNTRSFRISRPNRRYSFLRYAFHSILLSSNERQCRVSACFNHALCHLMTGAVALVKKVFVRRAGLQPFHAEPRERLLERPMFVLHVFAKRRRVEAVGIEYERYCLDLFCCVCHLVSPFQNQPENDYPQPTAYKSKLICSLISLLLMSVIFCTARIIRSTTSSSLSGSFATRCQGIDGG